MPALGMVKIFSIEAEKSPCGFPGSLEILKIKSQFLKVIFRDGATLYTSGNMFTFTMPRLSYQETPELGGNYFMKMGP